MKKYLLPTLTAALLLSGCALNAPMPEFMNASEKPQPQLGAAGHWQSAAMRMAKHFSAQAIGAKSISVSFTNPTHSVFEREFLRFFQQALLAHGKPLRTMGTTADTYHVKIDASVVQMLDRKQGTSALSFPASLHTDSQTGLMYASPIPTHELIVRASGYFNQQLNSVQSEIFYIPKVDLPNYLAKSQGLAIVP